MQHMEDYTILHTEVSRVPVAKGNTRVSVTLSQEMHEKIKRLAEEQHRTVSAQIAYELYLAFKSKEDKRMAVSADRVPQ